MGERVSRGAIGQDFGKADLLAIARIAFHLARDAVHDRYRLDRPGAAGGFSRKHHRIGPVIDRIGHVRDFGPRRRRAFDHRFEHLRGDHHRLAAAAGGGNDPLLDRRHFLGIEFDTQVTARHHDPVGQLDDFLQPVNRGGLFDLGHQRAIAAHQAAGLGHVLGPLDEGQGDPVGPVLHREGEIPAVLLGQRGDRHHGIGHVHALAVHDHPADLGRTEDRVLAGLDHLQPQLAIVDQQPLALLQHPEQFRVGQADAAVIARFGIAVEGEVAGMADHRLAALELADAQLRPLQVAQDRHRAAHILFDLADRGDGFAVSFVIAVAHVDAERVGPGQQQLLDHFRAAAGWPQRCQDLDLAAARIELRHCFPSSGQPAYGKGGAKDQGLSR